MIWMDPDSGAEEPVGHRPSRTDGAFVSCRGTRAGPTAVNGVMENV